MRASARCKLPPSLCPAATPECQAWRHFDAQTQELPSPCGTRTRELYGSPALRQERLLRAQNFHSAPAAMSRNASDPSDARTLLRLTRMGLDLLPVRRSLRRPGTA